MWGKGLLAHIDGLVQERRNSSALTMELRLSCTNPSIWLFIVPSIPCTSWTHQAIVLINYDELAQDSAFLGELNFKNIKNADVCLQGTTLEIVVNKVDTI